MLKKLKCVKNRFMKKELATIDSIRKQLENIKGSDVKMQVNKGRKKIVKFDAKLISTYPSIFTVYVQDSYEPERSYSYTEVLCGNVKICYKNIKIL